MEYFIQKIVYISDHKRFALDPKQGDNYDRFSPIAFFFAQHYKKKSGLLIYSLQLSDFMMTS